MAKQEPQRIIKVIVSQEEQDMIRLAAALRRTNMADFCRTVALEAAGKLTADIRLPDAPKSPQKRKAD